MPSHVSYPKIAVGSAVNLVVGTISHAGFTFSLGYLVVWLGQAEARFTQHLVCQKIVVASSFRESEQVCFFLFSLAR